MHETVSGFDELADLDTLELGYHAMKPVTGLLIEHPWLGVAREIAQREGFFHWELDFAQIFAGGGFDLQLGNPPWVRLDWKDDVTLAEHDPFFVLQVKIPDATFRKRRAVVLSDAEARARYLDELAAGAGLVEHIGDEVQHPVLAGLRGNLYMSFMERTWRSMSAIGTIGLLHPESHFTDPKAGQLRAATYSRLRFHWQFINEAQLFEDIDHHTIYGVHVYGASRSIGFRQAAHLQLPETLDASLTHDGTGEVPGLQYSWGGWDLRPHASRILFINDEVLTECAQLFDETRTSSSRARLLRPVTQEHLLALSTIARQPARLAANIQRC